MEIVFNDYSLTAQFETDEDFMDSLIKYTFPLLDMLKRCCSIVLKKYESYSLNVTSESSIYDLLTSNKYRGYPEFQKFRSLLADLSDTPYWEEEPKTVRESLYWTRYTGDFSGEEPNCFSEAYEREKIVLSIENEEFIEKTIAIKKDGVEDSVNNFYDLESSIEFLFERRHISFSELLHNIANGIDIIFYKHNDTVVVDKEISNEEFSHEDLSKIIKYFKNWNLGITNGTMLSHLTDSIDYKGVSFNELRITLDKRELRMFYKIFENKYVFFNILVKDTTSTPKYVKEKTYNLINSYIRL